jgi:hypothetical protein
MYTHICVYTYVCMYMKHMATGRDQEDNLVGPPAELVVVNSV